MGMTPLQTTALIVAIGALVVFVYLLFRTYQQKKLILAKVETFGFSGKAGDTLNLSCPAGKTISIYRAKAICGDYESTACDPDTSPDENSSIPAHALNVTSTIGAQANGKQSASVTLPSGLASQVCSSGSCSGNTGVLFSGTYTCSA